MNDRSLLYLLLLSLCVLAACLVPDRGRDDDDTSNDDDSAGVDDDDATEPDDDDATEPDDDDATEPDDDDATSGGPTLVAGQGSYRFFNDLSTDIEGLGYTDCYHIWLVQPTAGTPQTGCPGCTFVMRVDATYQNMDCSTDLFEDLEDFNNIEIGIAGDNAYQWNGTAWAEWMTGETGDGTFSGSSESVDFGQYVRTQQLELTWTVP